MRIAHLTSAFFPSLGGAEVAVHNLAVQQQAQGHDVTVVAPWGSWRVGRSLPYRLVPLLPKTKARLAHTGGPRHGQVLRRQLGLLQRVLRPDVWHVHLADPFGSAATGFLHRYGLPGVLTCQGQDVQRLPSVGYGARLDPEVDDRIRATIPQYDAIGAISESVRTELLGLGVAPDRVHDIPNGTDADRISSTEVDPKAVRRRLGLPTDRPLVLTVGRNHPKKGYDLIPATVARLASAGAEFHWVVVGGGCEALATEVSERHIDHVISFLPEIGQVRSVDAGARFPSEELVELYKAADLFVLPSRLEGFALVLVEAMAAGLAVVTTDAPGCRDAVDDEVNGLVARVDSVPDLAAAVARLLADAGLRRRLGDEGRRRAPAFGWDRIATEYMALYREVCDVRRPPTTQAV